MSEPDALVFAARTSAALALCSERLQRLYAERDALLAARAALASRMSSLSNRTYTQVRSASSLFKLTPQQAEEVHSRHLSELQVAIADAEEAAARYRSELDRLPDWLCDALTTGRLHQA
jgi:hypothetical protein